MDEGAFDDQNIRRVRFWGAYATLPLGALPGTKLDLYYLGLDNPHPGFDQGRGRGKRHTIGTRFFGTEGPWDFNDEAMYHFD